MNRRLSGILVGWLVALGTAAHAQDKVWDQCMTDASRAAQANQAAQAQQLYEKALSEAQKFGPKDPRLDKTLVAMETLYEGQRNWPKAESYCRQLVSTRERSLGPDHLGYAQTVNNLAVLLALQSKNAESEQNYKKALKIVENALGTENRYTAMILENYAPLLRKLNRTAEAEKVEQQLNNIRKAERELVAAATPAESASASIGIATGSAGRQGIVNEDADQPSSSSSSTAPLIASAPRPRFFEQDVNEMLAMSGLSLQYMLTGDNYRDKGDHRHAEKLYKMSLETSQLSAGPRSMETVLRMNSLARCYEDQGKYALAEPLFKRTVVVYANMADLNDWHLQVFAKEYADILRKVGNRALAAQVDQFVENIDAWINDPASRNASYCAWLQEEKPPESGAFTAYQKDLERRIMANWTRPYGQTVSPPVVVFTIDPDGSISHLEMLHTSESIPADQAALKAVSRSAPFPALPPETNFEVRVEFTFDGPGKCVIHHQ
ncbi:MAG: TonB family protein [Acidobacteriales bacterium]|nr:TonB family protein [Terriglobales bacterium]